MMLIRVPNQYGLDKRYMDFIHEIGYTMESLRDIFRLYFSGGDAWFEYREIMVIAKK